MNFNGLSAFRGAFLPVTGMVLAPELDPAHWLSTAEVVAVARFTQPAPLAGCLAGLAAGGLRTIALAILGARIGNEKLAATPAFSSGLCSAHCEPHHAERVRGRKFERIPEEDEIGRRKKRFGVKGWKKTAGKKTDIQTASVPPLSFRR